MTLLEEFEELCKYIREVTGSDLVCGLCEYDAGTVGEEPMECPGFESNECFVLKESLRKQYEMYAQVIRCKDCVDCKTAEFCHGRFWKYCETIGSIVNDDDYCSWAVRRKDNG